MKEATASTWQGQAGVSGRGLHQDGGGVLNLGGDRARWPAECWEHRAGWRASRLHAERPLSPSLGWLVLALLPPPAQSPCGAGRGNATLMMDPHLGRFAKGQE